MRDVSRARGQTEAEGLLDETEAPRALHTARGVGASSQMRDGSGRAEAEGLLDETTEPRELHIAVRPAPRSRGLAGLCGPMSRLVLTSTGTILNGTLGPGMLLLPLTISRTGLGLGAGTIFLVWLPSLIVLVMIVEVTAITSATSLAVPASAYGPRMSALLDVSVVLYFFGSCISYLILTGGTLGHVLHLALPDESTLVAQLGIADHDLYLVGPGPHAVRRAISHYGGNVMLAGFTAAAMLPLSCHRSATKMASFSSVVAFVYMYLCAAVLSGQPAADHREPTADPQHSPTHLLWAVMRCMCVALYCFSSQAVYPSTLEAIYKEGGPRAKPLALAVSSATYFLTFVAYSTVGIGGYLVMPGRPPANVLHGYAPTPMLLLSHAMLVAALGLSFPLMLLVAREHLKHLLQERCAYRPPHRELTAFLVFLALFVAIVFPSVEVFLGLVGATCSVTLTFVIPPLLYKHHVLDDLNSAARTWGLVCVYAMLVLGVVVAAVAIPVQVHELLIFLRRRRAPVTQHPAPVF